MPITLSSFSLPAPATIILPDGTQAPLRPLSMAEDRAVERAFDEPPVPLVKDPDKGSKAPRVPDTNDPVYRRAAYARYVETLVAKIAVAIGLELDAGGTPTPFGAVLGDPGKERAWLRDAVDGLADRITGPWLDSAAEALRAVSLGEQIGACGEGFTGTPSGRPTATTGDAPDD